MVERISSNLSAQIVKLLNLKCKELSKTCHHNNETCVFHLVQTSLKNFIIGYVFRAILELSTNLTSILKHPKLFISKVILNKENLNYAAYLTTYNFVVKFLTCHFKKQLNRQKLDAKYNFLIGFLAGYLGISQLNKKDHRVVFATIMLTHASLAIFNSLQKKIPILQKIQCQNFWAFQVANLMIGKDYFY